MGELDRHPVTGPAEETRWRVVRVTGKAGAPVLDSDVCSSTDMQPDTPTWLVDSVPDKCTPTHQPGPPTPRASALGVGERRRLLGPGWPLSVLFLGFPVWWVAGLSDIGFILAAIPMAVHLYRQRRVLTPPGFGIWLLFLLWMFIGVLVLQATAPGTVDGGGSTRIFSFGYRAAMYLAITTVLLYVCNLSERELPNRRVARLLAYMFIVTTVGGFLGVVLPSVTFHSLMELVLPHSISGQPFVSDLIHPKFALVSNILGYTQPRPVAPFAWANSWGANFALYLPFFLLAWVARGNGWRRIASPLVIMVALVPIVYSLDRGLWLGLGVAALYFVVRYTFGGHLWIIPVSLLAATIVIAVFFVSPLHTVVSDRIANPHSNEGRSNLVSASVSATVDGSPILGFGGPRQLQGTFASINGGATDKCPACQTPPLGTQGTMWNVVLGQGLIGTGLFLIFFITQFVRSARNWSPYAVAGCAVLLMFGVYLLVYDLLGPPMFTVMIACGLMWRVGRAQDFVEGQQTPLRPWAMQSQVTDPTGRYEPT